ncbi:MAG: hypothetical protein GXO43_04295 [Crenarchaeota archaeon]|nr:hypothetical protein [Thermoproteota archaeon]
MQTTIESLSEKLEKDPVFNKIINAMLMLDSELDELRGLAEEVSKAIEYYGSDDYKSLVSDDSDKELISNILDDASDYLEQLKGHIGVLDDVSDTLTKAIVRYLSKITGKKVMHRYDVDENTRDVITWMYAETKEYCLDISYIDENGEEHYIYSKCI